MEEQNMGYWNFLIDVATLLPAGMVTKSGAVHL
jgi:hypothetical protein